MGRHKGRISPLWFPSFWSTVDASKCLLDSEALTVWPSVNIDRLLLQVGKFRMRGSWFYWKS